MAFSFEVTRIYLFLQVENLIQSIASAPGIIIIIFVLSLVRHVHAFIRSFAKQKYFCNTSGAMNRIVSSSMVRFQQPSYASLGAEFSIRLSFQ